MNYQTAKFVAEAIDDLEHKIRVAATERCYREYNRELLDKSVLTVLAKKKGSPRQWDQYITNNQELFLLLAHYNQCEAEEAFRNKDISSALILVAEGNFEIGCFYGSHHIVRENTRAAAAVRHVESQSISDFAKSWYSEHKNEFKSKTEAAVYMHENKIVALSVGRIQRHLKGL